MTINDAYAMTRPAEITFGARVTSQPSFFYGSRTHCEHEAFDVQTGAGPVHIVDNVALAPRIAVQPGDVIRVRGEMVHDPGKAPIVHWTHHDPAGERPDGFIELHGRVYA